MTTISPGDVYIVDCGMTGKVRPAVVISRNDPDAARALILFAPLTTQARGGPYEVDFPKVPWLAQKCVVSVQGIVAIGTEQLGRRLGILPKATMVEVKESLRYIFEL